MKYLFTDDINAISFALSLPKVELYNVKLTKIVGGDVLNFNNISDENIGVKSHYSALHYDPLHYDTIEYPSNEDCINFATINIPIDEDVLGGDYTLQIFGEVSGELYYTGLSKITSDISLSGSGGAYHTLSQDSVYADSKII